MESIAERYITMFEDMSDDLTSINRKVRAGKVEDMEELQEYVRETIPTINSIADTFSAGTLYPTLNERREELIAVLNMVDVSITKALTH